jgi:hypothetical protein
MKNVLHVYKEIEETAEEIYYRLRKEAIRLGRVDVADVLFRLMLDEELHSHQLNMAIQIAEYDRYDLSMIDGLYAESLLVEIKALLQLLRDKECSLTCILELAITLEDKFVEIHALNALKFKFGRIKSVFEALCRGDEEHVAELKVLEGLIK